MFLLCKEMNDAWSVCHYEKILLGSSFCKCFCFLILSSYLKMPVMVLYQNWSDNKMVSFMSTPDAKTDQTSQLVRLKTDTNLHIFLVSAFSFLTTTTSHTRPTNTCFWYHYIGFHTFFTISPYYLLKLNTSVDFMGWNFFFFTYNTTHIDISIWEQLSTIMVDNTSRYFFDVSRGICTHLQGKNELWSLRVSVCVSCSC